MKTERTARVGNIIRVVAIAIAVISLLFNIYVYRQNRELSSINQIIQDRLVSAISELFIANNKINTYEEIIRAINLDIDSLNEQLSQERWHRDSLMNELEYTQSINQKLYEKLSQIPDTLDFDDAQHLKFFYEWTRTEDLGPNGVN